MRRWILWLPLSLIALLAVVAAGALLARANLAEAGLKRVLAQRGFESAELTVTTLSHRQLEITDLDLGEGGPSAAHLAVRYTPTSLLNGVVERVEIDGPQMTVDFTRAQPLGPLGQALGAAGSDDPRSDDTGAEDSGPDDTGPDDSGPDDADGNRPLVLPADLPTVVLRNAAVRVRGARGSIDLTLDGRLGRQDGDLAAFLRGSARAAHTTADLIVSADRLRSAPVLALEMTGETDLARAPWPGDAPVVPNGGRARFAVEGELALPPLGAPLTARTLLERDGSLALDLNLTDVDLAGRAAPLVERMDGRAGLRAEADDGRLLLRLDDPVHVTADAAHADGLAALGLPDALAAELARVRRVALSSWTGGGELVELVPAGSDPKAAPDPGADDQPDHRDAWRLDARGSLLAQGPDGRVRLSGQLDVGLDPTLGIARVEGQPLRLNAEGLAFGAHSLGRGRFEGRLVAKPGGLSLDGTLNGANLTLSTGATRLRGVSLEAPLALRVTDAGTRLTLSDTGQLVLPELPATGAVRPRMPLRLSLRELEATLLDQGLQASARIDPGRQTATLLRQDAADLTVTATTGPIAVELSQTDAGLVAGARVRGARLDLADLQLTARGLDADVSYGTDRPLVDLSVERIEDTSGTPAFAPAQLDMTIQRNAQLWAAVGRARPIQGQVEIPFWLDHRVDTGKGGVDIGPATLTFDPDGLQTADLSPLLAQRVARAEGAVTLGGRILWSDQGLSSFGEAELAGLDVTTPEASIEGLSGTLRFDRLLPPQTEPRQILGANTVTAGVPLREVRLRFDLDWPQSGPVLSVALAEGRLADGRIYVERAQLAPLAERNAATVRVEGVSLSALVQQLDLEGVAADGTLDGEIPVAFSERGVEIDRGRLAAVKTGSIRVDLGETSDALASRGEQVALMVQALKDFQYDELSLTLNRPADGDMEIGITMQGKNPDVLDGYPFRFNISLTGDLAPIVAALQEGRRLTSDLLDRALDAAR